jgi:hypothetical protein
MGVSLHHQSAAAGRWLPTEFVIDPDAMTGVTLEKTPHSAGYEVRSAADREQGIARCHANPADVPTVCVFMPEQMGMETVMDLRRAFPNLAISRFPSSPGGRTCPPSRAGWVRPGRSKSHVIRANDWPQSKSFWPRTGPSTAVSGVGISLHQALGERADNHL